MTKIIKPIKLKKGDTVGIIAPSEPIIYKQKFRRGVQELKKLGLKVVFSKNIFKRYGGYMAGTPEDRLDDLHSMFKNKKIKAIFAARGGFCCNQLLSLIDWKLIKKNPKIIFGYSDVTVLLNAIYQKTGLVTFHGPNVELSISQWGHYTKKYFSKAVFSDDIVGKIIQLTKWKILKKGKASGRLIGGNLSVLRTLLNTPYNPNWKNTILFWEDTGITCEDLDHFLTHLKLAGVFDKISGMIIGKNNKLNKIEEKSDLNKLLFLSPEKIILEITKKYKFPIISDVDFGHSGEQITIPVGVKATIDTSKKLFSIDENAVN